MTSLAQEQEIMGFAGIQLHNVKFKGERILYEVALQDQFVAYSGKLHHGQHVLGAHSETI